jgi:hypothetical protein
VVGGETVDKVNITEAGRTDKLLLDVRADGKLYISLEADDPGANLDAEGYPGAFDPIPFTKQ